MKKKTDDLKLKLKFGVNLCL